MLTPIMSKNVAKGVKSTAQGKTPKLPLNDQVGCTLLYTRLLIFFHTNIIISINQVRVVILGQNASKRLWVQMQTVYE